MAYQLTYSITLMAGKYLSLRPLVDSLLLKFLLCGKSAKVSSSEGSLLWNFMDLILHHKIVLSVGDFLIPYSCSWSMYPLHLGICFWCRVHLVFTSLLSAQISPAMKNVFPSLYYCCVFLHFPDTKETVCGPCLKRFTICIIYDTYLKTILTPCSLGPLQELP